MIIQAYRYVHNNLHIPFTTTWYSYKYTAYCYKYKTSYCSYKCKEYYSSYKSYGPQNNYCKFKLKNNEKLQYYSCDSKLYQPYVSQHIYQILRQPKYSCWQHYFDKLIKQSEHHRSLSVNCNMLFSVITQCEAINECKISLCELIIQGLITNQSELDCVMKWLMGQIKRNQRINKESIVEFIRNSGLEQAQFYQELGKLSSDSLTSTNHLCKQMRNKYKSLSSQLIYTKVQSIFNEISPQQQLLPKLQYNTNLMWHKLYSIKPRLLQQQCNSPSVYSQHLSITGNCLRFRFPPEPNGNLHIGHLKAIRINFETARYHNGICILRYDDTNPETQSNHFVQQIENNIRWLGYTPHQVTYASQYFPQMLKYAQQLILQGDAYVCDCSQEEIELQRKNKQPSPYRDRSPQQNIQIFPQLSSGQTLRLKLDPSASNPTLRDPVIYRLKTSCAHPRTQWLYKVYPTYDFAHCISDSLQHIDYSFCSLEFEVRRELYYRILHLLGLYKPIVWEYSRLNLSGTVVSKRKIKGLIQEGAIDGWDDVRLHTIGGLKRRGYTAGMLVSFIDKCNSSRKGNQAVVQSAVLEKEMKHQLLKQARKCMGVLEPVKIRISNLNEKAQISSIIKEQKQQLQEIIYIDLVDVKKFKPQQLIILKYEGVFTVQQMQLNSNKQMILKKQNSVSIETVKKKYKDEQLHLPIVQWVGEQGSYVQPIVMYAPLMDHQGMLNKSSRINYKEARVSCQILYDSSQYWQLERIGFFKFCDGQLICCVGL